jgi:hypothetical protein
MDANDPRREDDLSEFERRLAGWRPASAGPGADAMLFAAGLAAGRRGRGPLLWPALCALLAVQAAGLTAWALAERGERRALAARLSEQAPPNAVATLPAPTYTPAPSDYFSLRRLVEQDTDRSAAVSEGAGPQTPEPPPPGPAILSAGQRDYLFEQ